MYTYIINLHNYKKSYKKTSYKLKLGYEMVKLGLKNF